MKALLSRKLLVVVTLGICSFFSIADYARSSTVAARLASAAVVKTIGPGSSGSGVLIAVPKINGSGTTPVIVTAGHVLKGTGKAETVEIRLYDDSLIEVKGSDIVYIDDVDLAFIRLDNNALQPNKYTYAKVGNSNILNHGDYVVVSGYPLELQSNVSNRVRISEGSLQTFSSTDANTSLAGYSAITFPGMSGGGVFNSSGELVYIHLKGEKDIDSNVSAKLGGRSLKSGTNYGVSALHAINKLREQETSKSMPGNPLSRYQRGLFFVQSNDPISAHKIFSQLYKEYPDSLVAEWSTKCMEVQVRHPYGQPSIWPEGELSRDVFVKKHGVKPLYWWPYFSDSAIWKEKDRRILLSYDPIYKLAKSADNISIRANRGALVKVNDSGHCEYLPGLNIYRGATNKEIAQWEMIGNPSEYVRRRDFETDSSTYRQILVRPK